MKWIIAGLGNPEPEYRGTRHNAGRFALDEILRQYAFPDWEYKKTYNALVSKGEIAATQVLLIAPETYMNDSGKSLHTLIKEPSQAAQLIVLYDDIDLPLGTWRISFDRGSGGHNGIKSLTTVLKTKAFIRIRIGICQKDQEGKTIKPKGKDAVLAHVLGKFTPDEKKLQSKVAQEISMALPTILTLGKEKAMETYN